MSYSKLKKLSEDSLTKQPEEVFDVLEKLGEGYEPLTDHVLPPMCMTYLSCMFVWGDLDWPFCIPNACVCVCVHVHMCFGCDTHVCFTKQSHGLKLSFLHFGDKEHFQQLQIFLLCLKEAQVKTWEPRKHNRYAS